MKGTAGWLERSWTSQRPVRRLEPRVDKDNAKICVCVCESWQEFVMQLEQHATKSGQLWETRDWRLLAKMRFPQLENQVFQSGCCWCK